MSNEKIKMFVVFGENDENVSEYCYNLTDLKNVMVSLIKKGLISYSAVVTNFPVDAQVQALNLSFIEIEEKFELDKLPYEYILKILSSLMVGGYLDCKYIDDTNFEQTIKNKITNGDYLASLDKDGIIKWLNSEYKG